MGDFLVLNKPKEIKYILIYNILLRDKIIRYNFNISNIGNGYGGREGYNFKQNYTQPCW